LDVELE